MFFLKEWKFLSERKIDQLLCAKAQAVQESTFLQTYCFAAERCNLIMELSHEKSGNNCSANIYCQLSHHQQEL